MITLTIPAETKLEPIDRKHWNTPQPNEAWVPWTQESIDAMTTLKEFIAFFEAIPVEKWCRNVLMDKEGRRCARGHLGTRNLCLFHPSLADQRLHTLAPEFVWHNNEFGHNAKEGTLTYLRDCQNRYAGRE